MDSDIYKICGESDLLPELEKIQSDPNFCICTRSKF